MNKAQQWITLVPYMRDFDTEADTLKAFNANKDFRIMDMSSRWDGKPASKRELFEHGYTHAKLRFDGHNEITVVDMRTE